MIEKNEIKEALEGKIIEDLIDGSGFVPNEHEAYAFVMNEYDWFNNNVMSRTDSLFMKFLDDLDWDKIEKEVCKILSEINDD
jgi:hypothetical protein